MSNLVQDFQAAQQWMGYVGTILKDFVGSGVSSPTGTTVGTGTVAAPISATSISLGLDPLPPLTAGLNGLTSVMNYMAAHLAAMQTPEMVQASEAEKLEAFRERIIQDLQEGNETDLEKLEAS